MTFGFTKLAFGPACERPPPFFQLYPVLRPPLRWRPFQASKPSRALDQWKISSTAASDDAETSPNALRPLDIFRKSYRNPIERSTAEPLPGPPPSRYSPEQGVLAIPSLRCSVDAVKIADKGLSAGLSCRFRQQASKACTKRIQTMLE